MSFSKASVALLFILCAGVILSGCVVSPVPEPPAVNAALLSIELISTSPDNPDAQPDTAIIRGEAGAVYQRVGSAVQDGQALIRVVNLDLAEEPREVTVEADGSFSVSLAGRSGQLFRLRAYADELWSDIPIDVLVPPESGPVQPLPEPPSSSCLDVRAPSQLDFADVALGDISVEVIDIENECDQEILIEIISLRIGELPPPICEEEYQRCFNGELEPEEGIGSECFDLDQLCTENCDFELQDCYANGIPPEECDASFLDCSDDCSSQLSNCLDEICGDWLLSCEETPFEQPQGFLAHTGTLPLIIPQGSSRSIVVTFAPIRLGPAEDSLLLWLGLEPENRMAITLTGRGVE